MKNEFDVIAISETWYSDYSIYVNLCIYILIHQIRKTDNKVEG